jgi:hypothetical protein
MTATASRCDQIIALIDACLADLGPIPEGKQPQAEWSTSEAAEWPR